MHELIKPQRLKISLIFTVFILFLLNATGLFNLTAISAPNSSFNSDLFSQVFVYKSLLTNRIFDTGEFYVFLVTGILLSFLLPILNPIKASLLTFVCMGIPALLDFINPGHALLPLEYALMTILILYIVNILISYFMEIQTKQGIIQVFGQYIPPQLVAEISKSPGKVSMESETRDMTVLFCDLHNFTSSSELLSPQQISGMLNTYFTEMSNILHAHNATIDKFIGDAVMAFWGAPLPQADHAQCSVLAAFKLQEAIDQLEKEFTNYGWPATKMGIGISSGRMHVGNMGSQHRITYTVVGDTVNLASRLEALTRIYKVPTIVSESTAQACDKMLCRELDTVTVRGKKNETRIFQPLFQTDQLSEKAKTRMNQELQKQQQALQLYYQQDYQTASERFNQLAEESPADLYYQVMRDKSAAHETVISANTKTRTR